MREAGPTRFGYLGHGAGSTDAAELAEGGLCFVAKATVALNIGDNVLLDTANAGQVTKDEGGTASLRCGIVVGGTQTGMKALTEEDAVGLAAAAIDEQVLVCYSGICWGIAEEDDVSIGDKLTNDTTTAGRLLVGTDTTDTAAGITGAIVGTALSATAAQGDPVKVLVALA